MFARVGMTHIHPNKIEEGRRLWQEEIIPTMKRQKGFKGVYVLGNDKENKLITISLWDSEADANAWDGSDHHHKLRGKLVDKVTALAQLEGYEVKLQG